MHFVTGLIQVSKGGAHTSNVCTSLIIGNVIAYCFTSDAMQRVPDIVRVICVLFHTRCYAACRLAFNQIGSIT